MTMTRTIQDAATETGVSRDDDMGWIKLVQCLRATGMPIKDLHAYAELVQQGDATAPERLRILKEHRRRIQEDMAELATALELVERKITGHDEVLARGLNVNPPDHRPAPRRVRFRAAS